MKIIDLLNKIANGEESDSKTEFVFDKKVYNFYKFKNKSGYCLDRWLLNQEIQITKSLNDEVEILEDIEEKKIPEKIDYIVEKEKGLLGEYNNYYLSFEKANVELCDAEKFIIDKINSIIDYLKSKGDE